MKPALLLLLTVAAASPAGAAWQAVERVETYKVPGRTGAALYIAMGEHGPLIGGKVRAIAHTTFKLTWSRSYEPQPDGACILARAVPKLVITYTLPEPAEKLDKPMRRHWETFAAGLKAHELVHGDMIKEMVKAIEATSVGLTVADDRECKKIRTELTRRLAALSQAQRQKTRDFDRAEMSEGGNMHRLIQALVDGD